VGRGKIGWSGEEECKDWGGEVGKRVGGRGEGKVKGERRRGE